VGFSEEIVVRLDNGHAVTIVQNTLEQFEPGERVMLSPSKSGVRLEHAPR
jgi:outer membrane lipoprotein SlyB